MLQFIKGPWESGEDVFFKKINRFHKKYRNQIGEFKIKKGGLGFVKILNDNLPFKRHKLN